MRGLNVYPSGGGGGAGAPVERNLVYGADMEAGQYVGLSPDDNKVYPLVATCGYDSEIMGWAVSGSICGDQWQPLGKKVAMLSPSLVVAISTRTIQANRIFLRVGIIRGGQVVKWSPAYEVPITATTLHNFTIVRVNANQFAVLAAYTDTAVNARPANALVAGTATVGTGDTFTVTFGAVVGINQWDDAPGSIAWMDCAMCNISNTMIAISYHHNNAGGTTMCSNIRIVSIASNNVLTIGAAIPRAVQTEHNYVEHLACIDAGSPIHLAHTRVVAAGLFVEVDTISATAPWDVISRGTPVQLDNLARDGTFGRQYDVCRADTRKLTVVKRGTTVSNPYTYAISSYTSDASGNLTLVGSALTVSMSQNYNNQVGWYLTEAGTNRVMVGNVQGADSGIDLNYLTFPALTLFNVTTTPSIVTTLRNGAHNRTMHLQSIIDGGVWHFGFLTMPEASMLRGINAFIVGRVISDTIILHGAQAYNSGPFLGVTKNTGAANTTNPVYVDGIVPALSPGTFRYNTPRGGGTYSMANPIPLWLAAHISTPRAVPADELTMHYVIRQVSPTEVKICL